ncbi:MAG: hypothetical protein CM15mP70_05690 [Pelagibacteraceae bacterium]|nr:MAG: hypothetical protein CM15mP70_05690 [Pelagibacteraceae bacterium]
MSTDQEITGAEIILQALKDQEVDTIFGYPGELFFLFMIQSLAKTF